MMESSSIVSFNNDSTFQTTLKGDYNNISVHELALHAMRDRCLLLQRRINILENDNMKLKLDVSKTSDTSNYSPLQEDERNLFLQKIAELNKQKSQLMHHVFMVSCENKNLWTKISNLKKPLKSSREYAKQPLVRTNTYIHSTPKGNVNQEKYSEMSLEEISLKLINSYVQEKSQLVEQYEQMAQLQEADDDGLNIESVGFTYIEDPATDSLTEILCQTEKLQNLKKELAEQERDLKILLTRLEVIIREGYKCPTCLANNAKVTTSEHKEIETSDSLANWATPTDSSNYNNNFSELNVSCKKSVIEEKETVMEHCDKICPMCGETFHNDVEFTNFQSHVENHFMGETEPDSVIDNFENIHNSIDNVM